MVLDNIYEKRVGVNHSLLKMERAAGLLSYGQPPVWQGPTDATVAMQFDF